ncbi:MAG: hypothetical protein DMF25_08090 [Verrucomicrobia bacterium]|nr:MAG: hypothetical protein DMF25_08090 [Verrucomicrobiota bacterium]
MILLRRTSPALIYETHLPGIKHLRISHEEKRVRDISRFGFHRVSLGGASIGSMRARRQLIHENYVDWNL